MSAMKMRLFVKDILFFGIILSSVGISSQQVIQTGLHDVSNTVGDDIAYFTVTIDSAVTDAGVWRKDGQVLLRIPGKLIFPKSPGFRQLVIYTVQFSDAGLYTFTIAGEISQARLTVTDTQLRVVTPLVETRYTIGGTINLVTRLSSTGISNGEWYKDNVLVISESRRVISVDGTDQKLTIHNARSSDTGLYQYRLDGLETAAYVSETTGQWSNWGQWTNISTCPATCGTSATNLRRRVRQCNNPAAHNGGQSCVGSGTQTESFQCGPDPCIVTVHGGWSEWDNWGSVFCPVTCGVSVQGPRVRHRTCTNPSPQNGGRNCPGSGSETEMSACTNISPCAGQWSNWGQWTDISTCPATCGTSATNFRRRVRQCNNPAPQNGGQSCVGSGTQTESFQCGPDPCLVDGVWSEWGNWGSVICPVTCGVSVQGPRVRHRTCTNPSPQNGGRNCPGSGSDTEMSACTNISPCPNFEQTISDTAARSGGLVVLNVTTTQSGLTGTWYKNNQMLSSSDRVQIRSSGAVHTLTISDLQVSDTGRYNFTVNGQTTSAYLTVSDPISQQVLSDSEKNAGEGIYMVVQTRLSEVSGTWYKDNVMVSSSDRVSIQTSGTFHILQISNLQLSDQGLYNFTVNGESTSMYLTVVGAGPIKGQWSNWSRWTNISTCPATCGTSSAITRRRDRQCNIHTLKNGVQFCVGTGTQTESFQCGPDPCLVDGVGRNGITGGVLSVQLLVVYLFRVLELDIDHALI